jgi:hypothetical protein
VCKIYIHFVFTFVVCVQFALWIVVNYLTCNYHIFNVIHFPWSCLPLTSFISNYCTELVFMLLHASSSYFNHHRGASIIIRKKRILCWQMVNMYTFAFYHRWCIILLKLFRLKLTLNPPTSTIVASPSNARFARIYCSRPSFGNAWQPSLSI